MARKEASLTGQKMMQCLTPHINHHINCIFSPSPITPQKNAAAAEIDMRIILSTAEYCIISLWLFNESPYICRSTILWTGISDESLLSSFIGCVLLQLHLASQISGNAIA